MSDNKTVIMNNLQQAMELLTQSQALAVKVNPMAAEVPVFTRMSAMAKELRTMMLDVSKVRGLE